MTKRGDNPPDGEAGMTTAERRRYRRRGGGLRVPSDNVPRTPNARAQHDGPDFGAGLPPVAPDAVPTLVDPPADGVDGGEDFDTKTHEMTAVDLEALGLDDPMTTLRIEVPPPALRGSAAHSGAPKEVPLGGAPKEVPLGGAPKEVPLGGAPKEVPLGGAPGASAARGGAGSIERVIAREAASATPRATSVESALEVALHSIATDPDPQRAPATEGQATPALRRAQTVALSDDDLEEVRGGRAPAPPSKPPPVDSTTKPPLLSNPPKVRPQAPTSTGNDSNPASDRAASSQTAFQAVPEPVAYVATEPTADIEVEIEDSAPVESEVAAPPIAEVPIQAPRAQGTPPTPPRSERKPASTVDAPPTGAPPTGAPPTGAPPPTPAPGGKSPPLPPQTKKPGAAPRPSTRLESKPTGPKVKPWFVDLFDEDYLRTLPFLTAQATQAEAEFVIDSMSLTPGAQVLDVACGYGRHAMELAARGMHVVGLDLSTSLLLRGGEEAQRRGLTINFVQGDMRELDFEDQFDAAYCLFSSFGYFEDETNKSTLLNVARALKPKGRILLEILNRDYLIADLPTRVWWEGDGCVVLEEVEFNYFSSRVLVNRSVVFDDGRQLEHEISVRAYSLHEIGKLMHAAGFRVLEISGGYQMRGRFFGNQSRHIIVLAERKESFPR